MTRVYVFCEGQTEETFVREVLAAHFQRLNIWLIPLLLSTSRRGKGGVGSYGKIKRQLELQCKQDSTAWVTLLADFYAFPKDAPGMDISCSDVFEKVLHIIEAIEKDINQPNLIVNLLIHEFEGLLFSKPEAFQAWFKHPQVVEQLETIRQQFETPELIDEGVETAPSKRILRICNQYDKILHGSLIALDIGLDCIRKECTFFNQWVQRLEALSPAPKI